jgi:hypothetical protein
MAQFQMSAPQDVIDDLGRASRRMGISRCALVREAILLHQKMTETVANGGRILVESKDGQKEIVLICSSLGLNATKQRADG